MKYVPKISQGPGTCLPTNQNIVPTKFDFSDRFAINVFFIWADISFVNSNSARQTCFTFVIKTIFEAKKNEGERERSVAKGINQKRKKWNFTCLES